MILFPEVLLELDYLLFLFLQLLFVVLDFGAVYLGVHLNAIEQVAQLFNLRLELCFIGFVSLIGVRNRVYFRDVAMSVLDEGRLAAGF